jgi:hypothetical protein
MPLRDLGKEPQTPSYPAALVLSSTGWSYPSESDSGTVAALAPSGAIGLMSQHGVPGNTVPTQSSVSGGWDATI